MKRTAIKYLHINKLRHMLPMSRSQVEQLLPKERQRLARLLNARSSGIHDIMTAQVRYPHKFATTKTYEVRVADKYWMDDWWDRLNQGWNW